MFNSSLRAFGAAILLTLLTACTPEHNWREMPAADGAVRVAFPSRPHSETRDLPLAGESVPFTLTAAMVGNTVFAVGHLDLPATTADTTLEQARYKQVLEDSLARNLQASQVERRSVQVRGVAGNRLHAADEIEVRGEPGGKPAWLLARIVLVGNRLIEVAAVGPTDELTNQTARTFVDSLRLP